MISLPEQINKEQMFDLTIDTKPFIDIISCLNQMLKKHESKIAELDKNMELFCLKEVFNDTTINMQNILDELRQRSSEALDQSEKLANRTKEMQESLQKYIDEKYNDIIVTTQLSQKNNFDNFESKIDVVMEKAKQALIASQEAQNICYQQEIACKETKSNVQVLGERVHHVNSEFIKFTNRLRDQKQHPLVRVDQEGREEPIFIPPPDNTEIIEQIEERTKEQINAVQSSVADLLNDRLTSLQKTIQEAVMHPNSDNSPKLNEVWAITSQNRAGLLNAMTEQSLLSKRVDALQNMIDNIHTNPSNPESPSRPMLSSIMAHQNAASRASAGPIPLDSDIRAKEQAKFAITIDQLDGKMASALQDIHKIKNAFNRNEKDVRDVVLAIIDEFKLIRTNATGLEHLPPLNLATCVPSFFNNPSFTFDRNSDDSEYSCDSERSDMEAGPRRGRRDDNCRRGKDEISSDEESSLPRYHAKTVSGLMHLVSRPEPLLHGVTENTQNEQELEDEEQYETSQSSARSVVSNKAQTTETNQSKDHKKQVNVHKNTINVLDRKILVELKADINDFHKNKDELMSAVDRKVDRAIVEKVFDKFRVIINGLNNRIEEMASEINKLPKVSDVQDISDLVQKTAYRVNKIQLQSSIPRQTFGSSGEFIIGEDGTTLICNSSHNTKELPPLREKKKL